MFAASKSGSADAKDANFKNVTMLLHGNGTNGAQNNTFVDSSTNNFTITRNGNTTQGTFSPYGPTGYWSNYTAGSGSAASRVDVAGTSGLFGSNISYTIEGWFNYPNNTSGDNQNIIATNTNTFPSRWLFDTSVTGGTIQLRIVTESNGTVFNGSTVPYTLGTWVHLAVVNDNAANTCTFYVNGVAAGTRAKISLTAYSTLNLLCNSSAASAIPFYVSNFRLTNNVALYSANFTPSTLPFTAVSGTAVLTFQNNRFIDNSASPLTLTAYGTNQIQKFTPFAPPSYYQPSVIGGSGYFDGSGDSLLVSANTAIDVGSGDFTINVWAYPFTKTNGVDNVFGYGNYTMMLYHNNTNWTLEMSNNGSSNQVVITASVTLNAWQYISIVKSGTTVTLYTNAVSRSTGTISGSVNTSGKNCEIGANGLSTGQWFTGYISNYQLIKGSAVTPTLPTAPLTAVSGTSLLLSYTNAGILDNAMMNDLETVGNAQISTSVKKYGTGSIYMDGTSDSLFMRYTPDFYLQGSYTIEAWIYPLTVSGWHPIFTIQPTSASSFGTLSINQSGTTIVAEDRVSTGGTYISISGGSLAVSTWYHVALSVDNTSAKLFLNGVQIGSTTTFTNFTFTPVGVAVGANANGFNSSTEVFNGYIDDLRITKGVARYTTTFTPPTAAFADKG